MALLRSGARLRVASCAFVLLVALAGAGGATQSAGSDATRSDGLPLPAGLVVGGPSLRLDGTDPGLASAFSGAALVHVGGSCSGVLVRPGLGVIPDRAPAYLLTNGHCVGLFAAHDVIRDRTAEAGATVTLGLPDAAGAGTLTVPVRAISWATMKGTDLAVLELATSLAEVVAARHHPYPIAPGPAPEGTTAVIVGGPQPLIDEARHLRIAACALGPPMALIERAWSWFDFPANDCADIRPGSSGSPIFDLATGELLGLLNTTTSGSAGLSDCVGNRPCEVGPDGAVSRPDTSYGPWVTGFATCFDAGWRFTGPTDACALDPGTGMGASTWSLSANPDAEPPLGGTPRTTWAAELEPPEGAAFMRVASGPAGAIDCRDEAVYGEPVPIADPPLYDEPLPTESGHHLLCILAGPSAETAVGWQSARFPTVLPTVIDRTPPLPDIALSVRETEDGWSVEPIFVSPELSAYIWKWGPPASTDCADPAGYTFYRRFPAELPRADAPTRLCVTGYDDADNASAPLDRLFE